MISIVIIDDSKFMRMMLEKLIGSDSSFEIIGSSGLNESSQIIADTLPDVVLFDLKPDDKYLQKIKEIKEKAPGPRIIVLSTDTEEGSKASSEALKNGAFGMIQKPKNASKKDMDGMRESIVSIIKDASKVDVPKDIKKEMMKKSAEAGRSNEVSSKVVVICTSTGGPGEIMRLISGFPKTLPATIIICQQIHSKFTKLLMEGLPPKLKESSEMDIGLAEDGMILSKGHVVISKETSDLAIEKDGNTLVLKVKPASGEGGPSFDVLLSSVAESCGAESVGVLLTGEGTDGVKGLMDLKTMGGHTIVQDPSWGCPSPQMAKSAIESESVDHILTVEEIPKKIIEIIGRGDEDG